MRHSAIDRARHPRIVSARSIRLCGRRHVSHPGRTRPFRRARRAARRTAPAHDRRRPARQDAHLQRVGVSGRVLHLFNSQRFGRALVLRVPERSVRTDGRHHQLERRRLQGEVILRHGAALVQGHLDRADSVRPLAMQRRRLLRRRFHREGQDGAEQIHGLRLQASHQRLPRLRQLRSSDDDWNPCPEIVCNGLLESPGRGAAFISRVREREMGPRNLPGLFLRKSTLERSKRPRGMASKAAATGWRPRLPAKQGSA